METSMKDEITMLKISNVSKIYRLGEIGGTTLKEELQRFNAKIRKKEDPTKKIGAKNYNKGEIFKALDDLNFSVKKGERVGIIGHNGAGKSTLLKLISRVTAPSSGAIYLNGRITSMLEVGTGFHPELTGRENIYLNGAILGMTKKEIDKKMEEIIDFSEVRQFIDTPVKRYSSGMYVKLAFSVAAHLDSEIMIMDEVLAVGDVAFQNKCLKKMKDVSTEEDKTILYVSHNMNTIRELCNRVIVLNKGKIIYDGDVEHGIDIYCGRYNDDLPVYYDLKESERAAKNYGKKIKLLSLSFLKEDQAIFNRSGGVDFELTFQCNEELDALYMYLPIKNTADLSLGVIQSDKPIVTNLQANNVYVVYCKIDSQNFFEGEYHFFTDLFIKDISGNYLSVDRPVNPFYFKVIDDTGVGSKFNNGRCPVLLGDIIVNEVYENEKTNKN